MKTYLKRLKIKHSHAAMIAAAFVALSFQNCSKARFSSPSDASNNSYGIDDAYANLNQPNTNPNSCYTFLHQTTIPIRLLFVVDQSGSNTGANGTDPNQTVRAGSITTFFNDYQSKTDFQWGMLGFAGTRASSYISSGSMPVFAAASYMASAISNFQMVPDSGNTPYQAALDATLQTINGDTTAPAGTKYIVVWLSDGLPNPDIDDAILAQDVKNVINAKPGQVTFNTVYYGPGDPTASERLKAMAATGNGYFLDTNRSPTGKDFLISNVIEVAGTNCAP